MCNNEHFRFMSLTLPHCIYISHMCIRPCLTKGVTSMGGPFKSRLAHHLSLYLACMIYIFLPYVYQAWLTKSVTSMRGPFKAALLLISVSLLFSVPLLWQLSTSSPSSTSITSHPYITEPCHSEVHSSLYIYCISTISLPLVIDLWLRKN